MTPSKNHYRAFTLIEVIAVIVVMSIIAGVAAPVLLAVSNTYTQSMEHRTAAESVSIALDRIIRIVRETPELPAQQGAPDITAALPQRLELGDGTVVELTGSNLMLTLPTTAPAILCAGVSSFELLYLKEDAQPLDTAGGDPTSDTYKVEIRIAAGDIELRSAAFIRAHLAS